MKSNNHRRSDAKRKKTKAQWQFIAHAMSPEVGPAIPYDDKGDYKVNCRKPKNARGAQTRLIMFHREWNMERSKYVNVKHLTTLMRGTSDGMFNVVR
jgi:hypothetical protein